jgi:ATP-dependent Clp protease ATP-binding subunit ClpA
MAPTLARAPPAGASRFRADDVTTVRFRLTSRLGQAADERLGNVHSGDGVFAPRRSRISRPFRQLRELAATLARQYGRPEVEDEDVLLALVRIEGLAGAFLAKRGVTEQRVREVLPPLSASPAGPPGREVLSKLVTMAMAQSLRQRHGFVGTAHLLYALLERPHTLAAVALERSGVTLDETTKADLLAVAGTEGEPLDWEEPSAARLMLKARLWELSELRAFVDAKTETRPDLAPVLDELRDAVRRATAVLSADPRAPDAQPAFFQMVDEAIARARVALRAAGLDPPP